MSGTVEKQRPDDRSESEEEEDEEEEDEEEEEVASQEEESTAPLFHHHPYHSYSFAATSWELRKNLTETFNKHVEAKKEGERSESRPTSIQAAQTVFPISSSSNNIITDDSKKHSSNNALGKPPRKPHSQPANKQETTKTMVDNKKHNVSVYLRVRPTQEGLVNTIEILPGNPPSKVRTYAPERSNAAKINRATGNNSTLQLEPPTVAREFEFEKVFGPDQKQENIYSDIVAPMVERMFPKFDTNANTNQEPESGLLFAYGATNAGKTYSILGKLSSSDKREPITKQEKHWGIVPRAFQDILGNIERYQELDSSQDMELYLSIYEIYNENIYDLLADATSSSHPIFMREPLKLRESRKQTFIRGLARKKVTSVSEGLKYARQANSKRHTSSNNLNSSSSRSHSICQLQIIRRQCSNVADLKEPSTSSNSVSGYNTDEEASLIAKENPTTLWIVDLAGSERSKRTNVGFLRQKEASLINKSLMNLMRCLTMMKENQSNENSGQIIPFRENKLTQLFMPIFTGRSASHVSMIVNVNPAAPDFDETNHVLSYASQAKMVTIAQSQNPDTAVKQVTNTLEYGYDGRPAVKKAKTAASKIKSLMKKFSPKKIGNSSKPTSKETTSIFDKKRKAVPPARVPSFNTSTTSFSKAGTKTNTQQPQTKRMRLFKSNSQNSSSSLFGQSSASTTTGHQTDQNGDEIKSLKMALSIAQAEIEVLRSEKEGLVEQMGEIETQVRMEVSEEMESQINNTKQHYQDIIDRMKRQIRPSLSVTEKQDRMEKASEQIDVLLFKVDECEEEMDRMRENHQNEVTELQNALKEKETSHLAEIAKLKEDLSAHRGTATTKVVAGNDDEKDLIIRNQQMEIERLKKSKLEIIHNYEKLLNEANEDEEEEEHEDEDSLETETQNPIHFKRAAPRYTTRTNSKDKSATMKPTGATASRNPLASISNHAKGAR